MTPPPHETGHRLMTFPALPAEGHAADPPSAWELTGELPEVAPFGRMRRSFRATIPENCSNPRHAGMQRACSSMAARPSRWDLRVMHRGWRRTSPGGGPSCCPATRCLPMPTTTKFGTFRARSRQLWVREAQPWPDRQENVGWAIWKEQVFRCRIAFKPSVRTVT